jgi:hypothetical protein
MAGQNGLQNAAEREINDEEHQGGPFNPQVHRNYPNLDRPPTPANGLNLEEAGRPRGFNGHNVLRHPPPRPTHAFQAQGREVNENRGPLQNNEHARAAEEEEFPILQEEQGAAPNLLRNPSSWEKDCMPCAKTMMPR